MGNVQHLHHQDTWHSRPRLASSPWQNPRRFYYRTLLPFPLPPPPAFRPVAVSMPRYLTCDTRPSTCPVRQARRRRVSHGPALKPRYRFILRPSPSPPRPPPIHDTTNAGTISIPNPRREIPQLSCKSFLFGPPNPESKQRLLLASDRNHKGPLVLPKTPLEPPDCQTAQPC